MVSSINSSGTSSYSESLLDVLRSVSENPLNLVTIIPLSKYALQNVTERYLYQSKTME